MGITTKNLERVQNPQDKIASFKYKIYLAAEEDVDFEKWPVVVGGKLPTLPMKADKFCSSIVLKADTIKPNAASVGEVAPQGQLTVPATIEGLDEETLDWLYSNNGKRFVIIWEHCVSGKKFIAGSPCSTLKLSYESLGVIDDYQGANIKFLGDPCPEPFWFFGGEIPLPTEEVPEP